jgi:hypothetical protein
MITNRSKNGLEREIGKKAADCAVCARAAPSVRAAGLKPNYASCICGQRKSSAD